MAGEEVVADLPSLAGLVQRADEALGFEVGERAFDLPRLKAGGGDEGGDSRGSLVPEVVIIPESTGAAKSREVPAVKQSRRYDSISRSGLPAIRPDMRSRTRPTMLSVIGR